MDLLGFITRDNCSFLAKPFIVLCISVSLVIVGTFALSSDYISLLVILCSFVFGSVGSHFLLSSKDFPINSIPQLMEWKRQALPGIRHSKRCAVCGNRKCKRHRPELSVQVLKPWTGLNIPANVDNIVEEIFDLTFKEYVLPWYNERISLDEAFLSELKVSVRYLLATLVKRAQQVDLVTLITRTLAKALLQHADACLCASKGPNSVNNETEILKKLAPTLHRSMKSRKAELDYLRGIVEKLLPYLVPRKYLQSKSAGSLVREVFCNCVLLPAMDIIANPEIVNEFLILFFDRTPMVRYPESQEEKVELLRHFETGQMDEKNRSVLQTDLQTIMSHQQLLFPFMQFLKEEAAVNVLQFCLGVDDFNKRILNPDLTREQLISIHKEVIEMFNTYFAYGAVDRINFEEQVVEEMARVVKGDPTNVVILRTTTTLFKAYDYAYSQLEDIYCPLFHQSSRYFSLLCGDRLNNSGNRSLWRAKRPTEQSTMSKISSRIKGVFVTNVDNGRMFEEEAGLELGEGVFSEGLDAVTDDDDLRLKNLSAWRVSIPRIETLMDLNCKYYDAFVIEVKRIDIRDDEKAEESRWVVQRRYHEFYILAQKLQEFHDSLEISLPPKRSFGNKGRQYLESRRAIFEKFLSDLLAVPSLKGSELLYKFLKSPVEFTTNFLPEINFGKMIKTVPMKLIKEKGQHLLPFLQNFIASTEAAKPKPSKVDWKDIFELGMPAATEKLGKSIYKDNMGDVKAPSTEITESLSTFPSLNGIYDYILFIAAHVFKLPEYYLRIILTFEFPLRQVLQAYVEWYLDSKLNQALHPIRIQTLLENFRDILFFDQTPPKTDSEKMKVRHAALKATIDFFPDWLGRTIGTEKFEMGIETLFIILQNPRLNKQLSYRLLDIVLLELFPELRDDTPSPL